MKIVSALLICNIAVLCRLLSVFFFFVPALQIRVVSREKSSLQGY